MTHSSQWPNRTVACARHGSSLRTRLLHEDDAERLPCPYCYEGKRLLVDAREYVTEPVLFCFKDFMGMGLAWVLYSDGK